MHDGLVVVRRVLIRNEVIIVFVEVVLKSCREFQVIQVTATPQVGMRGTENCKLQVFIDIPVSKQRMELDNIIVLIEDE